jgi:hypothetical protein
MNLIERRLERFLREPPSVRNAAGGIVVATAAVVVGAGVLIRVIDSEEHPNIGIGLSPPYPIIGGGLTTMGSILLAGAPTGAVGNWAERPCSIRSSAARWLSSRPTCSGRGTARRRRASRSRGSCERWTS